MGYGHTDKEKGIYRRFPQVDFTYFKMNMPRFCMLIQATMLHMVITTIERNIFPNSRSIYQEI